MDIKQKLAEANIPLSDVIAATNMDEVKTTITHPEGQSVAFKMPSGNVAEMIVVGQTALYAFNLTKGGTLPAEMRGCFTTPQDAELAVKNYLMRYHADVLIEGKEEAARKAKHEETIAANKKSREEAEAANAQLKSAKEANKVKEKVKKVTGSGLSQEDLLTKEKKEDK